MSRGTLFAAGILLSAIMLATSAFAAGPAMSVNWTEVGPSQDDCVKLASDAVKQNRFTTNFEVIGNRTIYGERDNMTVAIRCVADKGIVFIAVAGGDGKLTSTYATAIRDAFSPTMNSPVMNGPPGTSAPPAPNAPPATNAPQAPTAPPLMDAPPRKGISPN